MVLYTTSAVWSLNHKNLLVYNIDSFSNKLKKKHTKNAGIQIFKKSNTLCILIAIQPSDQSFVLKYVSGLCTEKGANNVLNMLLCNRYQIGLLAAHYC